MLLLYIFGLILSGTYGVDYEDNDLAKVCRPIDRQLDLLFVLDGSGSVSGSTFSTQMQMLNRIVEMVDIGTEKTQIAVMQYSSYTRVEFGFSTHQTKDNLKNALGKIRHLSGTTKTGKALDKALHLFKHDTSSGARRDQEDVAQVAVVVTDGHSHDDPVPAAQRLRQAGVQILTLGIGAHINMGELFDITGDESLAFQNLTSQNSLDQFVNQFKKIAVGELCKFARGAHGAEIICNSDSIDIRVSTVNPFYGHLYVANQFTHSECVAKAENLSTEVYLPLSLTSCNIQKQSMIAKICHLITHLFYYSNHSIRMPCSYKISSRNSDQCRIEDTRVGETVIHSWECDKSVFDTYQSMLIHSCIIINVISGENKTLVDENGCSIDPAVMDSPEYVEPLTAFAVGKSVKFPDSSLIQYQCHLRFCDRLLGECDAILVTICF
ncbi:unnamed protein product [Enterobius vermicularis]|uniref:VWFA domain-containing protein n=1 Tax=Enterobius vermicularis TaxID=51028 RepID=A0A0N4UWK3_ENTVE|nr:unnamed protein product [Enterobius vermicularis]